MAICLRRWAGLDDKVVLSVSKTWARSRIMHTIDPTTPSHTAIWSFASTSHRPYPYHQSSTLSVGQMSGLIKFMRFSVRIKKTKDDAARLRALMYQTKAGVSIMRMTRANVGNATAAGATGRTALAIVNDTCLDIRCRCCERMAESDKNKGGRSLRCKVR